MTGRCRSYFYGRGVYQYSPGKRCELDAGHIGAHRNIVDARFLDPRAGFVWGGRCASRYPGPVTLNGRAIRCEETRGHDGQHGHSFAARYWDDDASPLKCAGCGEYWPCSDSQRTDIRADLRAQHFIARSEGN